MGKSANKDTSVKNKGAKAFRPPQKPFVQKQKGPAPSYTPNYGRIEAARRAEFSKKVAKARENFTEFVGGTLGDYLIGINTDDDTEAYDFTLKVITLPETETRPAQEQLIIEGDVEVYGRRVFIPHKWLFFQTDTCNFVGGRIGEVQYEMLTFLKPVLHEEIKAAKQHHFEERQAALAAKQAAILPPVEKVSKKIVPIQNAMRKR
jgi:hypothetical protein